MLQWLTEFYNKWLKPATNTSKGDANGFKVKVIADSICKNGRRLTTLQLVYPRFIHQEFLTHRAFSRNASSTRAIPVWKKIKTVWGSPTMPIEWGQNKQGMQAGKPLEGIRKTACICIWWFGSKLACAQSWLLSKLRLHKQIAGRPLEPYEFIHVVVSATQWDNWFNLRLHKDAQPEIQKLAKLMRVAMDESSPEETHLHLPYIREDEFSNYNIDEMQKISAGRCARVSYINHDGSRADPAKDIKLADMLKSNGHMTPLEHQAIAFEDKFYANFRGWYSQRYKMENLD